jgi:glycosyltransferase involved in cell wall biosynthesis
MLTTPFVCGESGRSHKDLIMVEFSAVIPCHNAENHLARAINSALAQSHRPSRIVIIDDASTDSSAEVARAYRSQAASVECVTLATNRGPGAARNVGLQLVEEPIVAFLDADDAWTADHCARVVNLIERHPGAVLAYGMTTLPPPDVETPAGVPFQANLLLLRENLVTQSAAAVRRGATLMAGGYRAGMRFAEDYDLWLRLADIGPFVRSPAVTCIRGIHEGQTSRRAEQMFRGAWAARLAARSRLTEGLRNEDTKSIDALLADALERDFAFIWRSQDRRLMQTALSVTKELKITSLQPIYDRWQRRLKHYWLPLQFAARAAELSPPWLRRLIRHKGYRK